MKQTYIFKAFCALLLAAFIVAPGRINAQKKKKKKAEDEDRDDSWDYTITRNSPAVIPPYTIAFYPLIMEATGLPGSGLGAEASLTYQVNDDFEAFGKVNYNYLTVGLAGQYDYKSANPPANYGIAVAGTWFFSNETKHKNEEVLLYSESTGYRSYTNHVAKIELDHQQKFGIRAGFDFLNYSIGDGDGVSYNLYNLSNTGAPLQNPQQSMLSAAHSGIFSIGLTSEKIHDYKLTFKNGQVRNISRKMSWHLDFLVNVSTTFDNVQFMDSTYDLNKFTPKSSFGARVGFESESLLPFGGNFGFDFGIVPGAPNQLLFMAFKYGMSFNNNMKSE